NPSSATSDFRSFIKSSDNLNLSPSRSISPLVTDKSPANASFWGGVSGGVAGIKINIINY
ncbi:hypothetical protein N9X24_02685, partial [Rickettsiales bacterium]|nr:hypothetical protein [Rickettsiales bacterium]